VFAVLFPCQKLDSLVHGHQNTVLLDRKSKQEGVDDLPVAEDPLAVRRDKRGPTVRDGPIFEEAARLFNLCQSRGVASGSTDILICAVAVLERFELLTSDQGLRRCMEVLQAEGFIP